MDQEPLPSCPMGDSETPSRVDTHTKMSEMRRVRVEHKPRRTRDDRSPVLPLDPRDPDILRAKRPGSESLRDKRL
jgi:hypothetical protein